MVSPFAATVHLGIPCIAPAFPASPRYRTAGSRFCIVPLHRTIDGTNSFLRAEGSLRSLRITSVFSPALRYRIAEAWLHNFLLS